MNDSTLAQPTDVPLPIGHDPEMMADTTWEANGDGHYYRCVWSPTFEPCLDIRVVVTQFIDGSIGTEYDDAPLVYIGCEDFLPEDARAIAASIVAAADLADEWVAK